MAKMRFIGTLEGEEYVITVENSPDEHVYNVCMNERCYTVDAHTMPSEIVSALIDNKSYDIDLERANISDTLDGRLGVRVRGRVVYLEMLDERRKKMKDAQATRFSDGGLARITSPMPGKVLRIVVAPGDAVSEGQGVAVVEAMKMENELKAPRDGTVKEVVAKAGESVDSGALLLTIE
jgi:biotin carboxyl carrier protein